MKLKDLLKVITHQKYCVCLTDVNCMGINRILYDYEIDINNNILLNYLDYTVVSCSEEFVITIKGCKIV